MRLGSVQGSHSFNLASGSLWITFSSSWGYQTVTFSLEGGLLHLPLIGGFSSIMSSKDIVMVSLEVEPGPCPKAVLLFLGCLYLVSAFLISKCLNLPLGTQGRSWRLNRKAPMPRSPRRSCSVSVLLLWGTSKPTVVAMASKRKLSKERCKTTKYNKYSVLQWATKRPSRLVC